MNRQTYHDKTLSIDLSGVTYIQLGYQEYQCHHGENNNIGKKGETPFKKKFLLRKTTIFLKEDIRFKILSRMSKSLKNHIKNLNAKFGKN